jgi:hypothetical protein
MILLFWIMVAIVVWQMPSPPPKDWAKERREWKEIFTKW